MGKDLSGIMAATITPFNDDGSVDLAGLETHVNRLISAGVHGLVPGGSTGEFTALTTQERKQSLESVIKAAAGRVPVVAGVGDLTTPRTVELAVHAARAGADALMVVPPYYEGPNMAQLREFLSEICKASGLPIMYYNIPSASGVNLSPKEIASLTDCGVKWLKDTSGSGPALTELLFSLDDRITAFNGWDTLTFYGLAAGAKGAIWGAVNVIPELSVELWDALAVKADLKRGREIWAKIWPIVDFFDQHHYTSGVKTGMELRGWKTGGVRKPWALLEPEHAKQLAGLLQVANVPLAQA